MDERLWIGHGYVGREALADGGLTLWRVLRREIVGASRRVAVDVPMRSRITAANDFALPAKPNLPRRSVVRGGIWRILPSVRTDMLELILIASQDHDDAVRYGHKLRAERQEHRAGW